MCSTRLLVALKVFLQQKDETRSCALPRSVGFDVLTYLNSCNFFFSFFNTVPR